MDEYDVLLRNGDEEEEQVDQSTRTSSSTRTEVHIRMGISKLYDIDTINQRFHAEVIVESKWHDASIIATRGDHADLKSIWRPEIYFENALNEVSREECSLKLVRDEESKRVMVSEIRKVKALFWENLELENFPLDVQDLSVVVASKLTKRHVELIPMQAEYSRVNIANTLDKSAWQLGNVVRTTSDRIEREYSFGKREYSAVRHTCQAYRLPGYFYWNALLPILLISFAALGPFLVDPKSAHARLPSTATMLLAAVSYKATVSRLLPTVSYLTSLDKYCLGAVVLIAGMFIYHSTFALVAELLSPRVGFVVDKLALIVFLCLLLLKQLIYGTWLSNVTAYRNKLRDEFKFHEAADRGVKKLN